MDFLTLIEKRRSIRKYCQDAVEPEKVAQIMAAALRAPSSRGLNPWEFIAVTEREQIDKLARAKQHGSSFLAGAPLAVVVCADPAKCDVWIEDASIAATFICLAAVALGLGHCWIQIRERSHDGTKTAEAYLREVLAIPENLRVAAIIAIGYPDEQKAGHRQAELQFEKIFRNGYGQK